MATLLHTTRGERKKELLSSLGKFIVLRCRPIHPILGWVGAAVAFIVVSILFVLVLLLCWRHALLRWVVYIALCVATLTGWLPWKFMLGLLVCALALAMLGGLWPLVVVLVPAIVGAILKGSSVRTSTPPRA